MEGVTTLEALGLRDLSAGLCCTTHRTTVLGQAPRRLTGFIASAQQVSPQGLVVQLNGMIHEKIL